MYVSPVPHLEELRRFVQVLADKGDQRGNRTVLANILKALDRLLTSQPAAKP
jgi:hypothetical protein